VTGGSARPKPAVGGDHAMILGQPRGFGGRQQERAAGRQKPCSSRQSPARPTYPHALCHHIHFGKLVNIFGRRTNGRGRPRPTIRTDPPITAFAGHLLARRVRRATSLEDLSAAWANDRRASTGVRTHKRGALNLQAVTEYGETSRALAGYCAGHTPVTARRAASRLRYARDF